MARDLEKKKAWEEANRERRREKAREAVRRYQERHPDRVKAHRAKADASRAGSPEIKARRALQKKVRTGKILREPCLFCDDPNTHGHHHDYSRPLDVTWLCSRHHGIVHRVREDREGAAA